MTQVIGSADSPAPRGAPHASALGRLRGRPILLAVDGSAASLAACRVAAALADTRGALPHAVRAVELAGLPVPAPVPALIAAADSLIGAEVHVADAQALRAGLAALVGRAVDWPVHVAVGAPAGIIAREAAALGAALVVMGIRRHGHFGRVVRDETTLGVMRVATCPVLGVTPTLAALPRHAVVGVDFGAPSTRAARAALELLAPGGTLVLAYVEPVRPAPDASAESAGTDVVYALGVDAAFDRLVADLLAPASVTVERLRLTGEPGHHTAELLLGVADERRSELLAVGSRRHDWLDRALLGSVTTDLARDGRHSLLVVPPPPAAPPHRLDAVTT